MILQYVKLKDIVSLADSGTWGDEGSPKNGSPVLRSSNIQNYRMDITDVAWRKLPCKDVERKRLQEGDIIVTTSSGSPDLIGKCCLFEQPTDGTAYYFSNFTLRLRLRSDLAHSKWIFYWLSSPIGRIILSAMNNTTSGLRNLNRNIYLGQKIPLPALSEQKRISAILDKADAIRRKRQEAIKLADNFLRATFLDMFGDIPSQKSKFEFQSLRPYCSANSGKSSKMIISNNKTNFPIYGGNGINGWAIKPLCYNPVIVIGRVGQQCGIVHVTNGPAWITDNAIILNIEKGDVLSQTYLADAIQNSPIRSTVERLDLPFINQSMILDFPLPIPPMDVQKKYEKIVKKLHSFKDIQSNSLKITSVFFNSLTQRAFRGDL